MDYIDDLREMKQLESEFDYQDEIKMLERLITKDESEILPIIRVKDKLNKHYKKLYWKDKSFTQNPRNYLYLHFHYVQNISPSNGCAYYKKVYYYNKDVRKKVVRKVRRKINGCVNENYDVVSQKGNSYKYIYNYKWDRW